MTNQTDGPNQSDQSDHDTSSLDDDEKLEQLATRFLALWREQVAATADGAQAASAIGRLYASLGADTTRMGEGFEAWGNLIGQMAMGQQLGAGAVSGVGAGAVPGLGDGANPFAGAANPVMAMMEQMAKAARDLPATPFPGMPFPPNMAGMAGMSGTGEGAAKAPAKTPEKDASSAKTPTTDAGANADASTTAAVAKAKPRKTTTKKTTAAKEAAKGQGKNDQSTKTKAAPAKKGKPKAGRATTASDAHGSRDDELAQLARRIADLSETIAALEGGTEGAGGKPPKGS
ncbi:MAG: hypothetical protein KTR23_03555 [Rhodospirillales bacterium]|nr:hypothetical protein [Rhodospirillales bacterium]